MTGGCGYNAREVEAFALKSPKCVSGVEYRVYPPDTIAIASERVPEFQQVAQRVSPDGKLNLPLVGEVEVAGLTTREIERKLTEAAKRYYELEEATAVMVTVAQYNSQSFYVFGQVGRPGPMPWTGRDMLLEVLCKAQPTELAWPERIILVRGDEPQVGGRSRRLELTSQPASAPTTASAPATALAPEAELVVANAEKEYHSKGIYPPDPSRPRRTMTINLMAMIRSGDMSNNVLLMPNDVVYVQPNPFAKLGLALRTILFPVVPVLETLRAPANVQNAAAGQ